MKKPVPRGNNRQTTSHRPATPRSHCCPPPQAGRCIRCLSPVGRSYRYCARCGQRLESPTGGLCLTQRRTVSVLFVDIAGFTELADHLEPEALRTLQTEYFRTVAEVIRRWGGIVEKYIGDAVMAVFGVASTDGRHAYQAVRAGAQIVEAVRSRRFPHCHPLRIRVGVATGEAVVDLDASDGGQGFVTGNVVNTAFRVQAHAAVGTVAVTAVTRRATGTLVPYRRLAPVRVAGRPEPLEIWRPEPTAVPAAGSAARAARARVPIASGRDGDIRTGPAGQPERRTRRAEMWRLGRCPPRPVTAAETVVRVKSPRRFGSSNRGDRRPPPDRDPGALPRAADRVPVAAGGRAEPPPTGTADVRERQLASLRVAAPNRCMPR